MKNFILKYKKTFNTYYNFNCFGYIFSNFYCFNYLPIFYSNNNFENDVLAFANKKF